MSHPYPALPIAAKDRPKPPKTPCADGFHWIGQSFATCDMCGLPAWEHEGEARLVEDAGPFADQWEMRPWEPGQAERIRAKWDPELPAWECTKCGGKWARTPGEPEQEARVRDECCGAFLLATKRGLG